MGHKHSKRLENNLGRDFYLSCCNGDLNSVRELLPILSYDEVNYIDPTTGCTSLHVACWNNCYEIARLLLENNVCDRIIRNRNNKTAYDVAASDEIRSLFIRPRQQINENRFVHVYENQSPFRLISDSVSESARPDNWVTGYFSIAEARDAQLMLALSQASPIIRFLLYTRTERESKILVRRLIDIYIPKTHEQYERAHKYYDEFLRKKSLLPLLTIYSLPTKFFEALGSNADAYTVILYLNLRKLSDRAYHGITYRGMVIPSTEIDAYRWAHRHASVVETRALQSTSKNRAVAEQHADPGNGESNKVSVMVRYKFTQICPTAISIDDISQFPEEEEVLLLPFTLFRVTSIKEDNTNVVQRYDITMQNIPVAQKSLWASSRKGSKRN
jgi:hypothetical protein